MQLIAPTPFNLEFLDKIKPYPVRYLYGSLPADPTLRSRAWLPAVDEKTVEGHVQQALAQGIGFLYVLNAACWGNREFTAQGQRTLVDRLGWLESIGASGVVAANPYIIEFIKNRAPTLQVYVSTLSNANSVDKVQFYRDLGCAGVHLPEYVNRNFKFLQSVAKARLGTVALTVNLGCLLHCPLRDYHANFISHSAESMDRGCYLDYSLMKCTQLKVLNPVELLKAPWIRPEDLSSYEAVGVEMFKISGRVEQVQWILRAIEAYSGRRYAGPLNDLLSGVEDIDPFGRFPWKIDNTALAGFLEFFERHDCSLGCDGCNYCDGWVKRSVESVGSAQQYQKKLQRSLNAITSGSFRAPLAGSL